MVSKKELSERDICTQFILPALVKAGWDVERQVREEVFFTDGRIYVKGNKTARGERKRADYILYYKPNIPVAVIEAKDNNHSLGAGMQQALGYAAILDIPAAFSSNGDGFLEHDRSGYSRTIERELSPDEFPAPEELWLKYKKYKGIETATQERIASQDYFFDGSGRTPRYYQQIAVNRTVEAIAKGQNRILLVMATGTGKTYTAFQIIYRLWKSGVKKRILFLADRNALLDQTKRGDFKHFKDKMTVIRKKKIDKAFEIYLALYQGLTGYDEDKDAYKQFSRDFFDLIVVDECHRGSAAADSAWREIMDYFQTATQIGLTATPKETREVSNIEYFGDPIYTYSLKQGIEDGFLAPYKVIRVGLNVDLEGWRPEDGKLDKEGNPIEDRVYNTKDFDRNLVIEERTKLVARKVMEFLRNTGLFSKTIIFCVDIEHAERMRLAIANEASAQVLENHKYVMKITGDDDEGQRELDNFINPEDRHIFGDIYETILRDLQSAGNYGEFYTPRAITEFMTEMVNPRLGEKVLDPACGTGGFLTSAIENIRRQDVKGVDDLKTLEETIHGMEFKPLPFMLCVTNLILHDIEVPNIDYTDSLNREYTSIGAKDRVDVILANPPFGASVTDGVETNFPQNYRTTESADLFLALMIRYLKDGGRAAIVLPDGSLTGDGVKQRIRQHFLESCNLHTIVRLPNSVFQPYASVATNLLFFTKGQPTKEIWYWEHQLPEGVKAYSKTKPIQKSEFASLKEWWNKREENEQAWKVSITDLEANGYNLDIKNPHTPEAEHTYTSAELLAMLHESFRKSDGLLEKLQRELGNG